MNFTEKVKNEILSEEIPDRGAQLSALSAYLRTAGTIETSGAKIGFSLVGVDEANRFFSSVIYQNYGITPARNEDKLGDRTKILFLSDKTAKILVDAGIIKIVKGGVDLELSVSPKLTSTKALRCAYIKGAFLGSGSVTVPKMDGKTTGYHFEVVFSKHATALDFCHILSENGLIARLILRKDSYVVYVNNSEELSDLLVLMGAKRAYLEVQDILINKLVKNNTNRAINCEMSNLTKTIDASLKQKEAIELIDRLVGLDSLPSPLKDVATARISYPDDTLSQLAERLNITKSCLSHRLKRILSIADGLN